MRLRTWLAAGLMVVLLPACVEPPDVADGGDETDEPEAEPLDFYDFFIAAETAYCTWAAACGAHESADDCHAVQFFDVTYDVDLLASGRFLGPGGGVAVKYLLESHEAGRIDFDAEAAEACLGWVESRGCDVPESLVADDEEAAARAACAAIFRGAMTRNEPCLLSMECAHDEGDSAVCGFDPNCTDQCCAGGCRVIVAVPAGTACNGNTRCEAGTYCARDPNTFQFTVCTPAEGVGGSCNFGVECGAGTFCDFNSATCVALAKIGEPCNGDGTCEQPAYCGDPSGNFEQYRCQPWAGPGEACSPFGFPSGCSRLDNFCDEATRTCAPARAPGESCGGDGGYCEYSAYCDYDRGRCEEAALLGEPCGTEFDGDFFVDVQCAGGLRCTSYDLSEGRCAAPEVTSVCAAPDLDREEV